jgi:two-component sensor histidine kinase
MARLHSSAASTTTPLILPTAVAPEGVAPEGDGASAALDERIEFLETALRQKDAALREIQHRAKNSLQMVISLLRLQHHRIVDPQARAAYDQTMHRVEALAILYRQVHESHAETNVQLGRYLSEVTESAAANLEDGQAEVPVELTVEPLATSLYTAMPLGLIVHELVSSAMRHAFPSECWLKVSLVRRPDGLAQLCVADNGRGLPTGFDSEQDAAMILVEALATQLGADLDISTAAGSRVTVTLPL